MVIPMMALWGLGMLAFMAKHKNAGSPTASAAAPTPTNLIGTGGTAPHSPMTGTRVPGPAGVGVGKNTTPIEILQLPPEVSAGRYASPVQNYFPAGFSGQLSPVSSLPLTPPGGVKPSGVQMTGTVGVPSQGVFMEGPVYTQRGTPSTPVGAYTMAEVSRPPSLPTGGPSPTSAVGVVNPMVTGPAGTTIAQTTATAVK